MSSQAEALNALLTLLEPALHSVPPQPRTREIERFIVAAKLEAHEASDMLGAVIASLEARYGEDAKALTEIRFYADLMGGAIMEIDK